MTSAEIVKNLIAGIGSVNSVEMHINMCIATRNSFGGNDDAGAMMGIMDYLATQLSHRLSADEAMALSASVMKLDSGVMSITL